ncbi:lytic transglycosylase domain-containing protein [Acinetobacter ursingii]|uniref:lytic transglycosylase domain-containing protein n=1 Tax=Acinetobacter ursingii TaxID=108980 RepID=UPI0012501A21|nr:lytic transglycosylase domain-containing protein [Acinetobacter ursingii]
MSNWLSGVTGDEQQSIDQLNEQGITGKDTRPKAEPSFFQGAISAPFRGAVSGAVKAYDTVTQPINRVIDHVQYSIEDVQNGGLDGPLNVNEQSFTDFHQDKNAERSNKLIYEVHQLEDFQNTGTVGNIAFGITDFITRAGLGALVGGLPGAAATVGTSTGSFKYQELKHDGVDTNTAIGVAGLNAIGDAVATALPISYGFRGTGGLLKDAALSIGGGVAVGSGVQAASGEILKSQDYNKAAQRYTVTGETLATDIALNALMFGGARYFRSRGSNLDQAVDTEINQLNADQLETRQDAIHETLVRNEMEFEDTTLPVLTDSPVEINNHYRNLDAATDQILNGQTVNVPTSVKGEAKKQSIDFANSALPASAKQLALKAQQSGINPSVALTISHIETGGKFNADAQNSTSSANGIFQVIDSSWKRLGGGNRADLNEQIRVGLKHIKETNTYMAKQLGRDPVGSEQYLGHLLGPAGATKVLKADPNTPLIDVVRAYDPKNANAIVKNNGMAGMTAGEAINKWQGKWNQLSSRYGDTSTAMGMDGSSYQFSYEIKDLNDLIASNDQLYGINPAYPAELQPRDRTREASRQQIEDMAADLKPEWLGESPMLSNGAPIIGLDNVVESGNGRTLAIGKAYENGRADAYREYVQNWANERGMDISGVNQPVLVRTRLSDVNRVEFARLANESDVAQMSASERARTDADRLPDASMLKTNSDGSLNIDSSMDFIRGFVDQLPQSERGAVITSDGRLSQEGKRRIESAIAQRAYDDPNLIARLAENIDDTSKNVLNALLRNAPNLAQLNDLVRQGGRFENTIAQDLAQAAQKLYDLKANDVQVRDYLNQNQLIDDGLSDGARRFLEVFDQNSKSAKAISQSIADEIQAIESMGDPRQGSLFGDTPEGKAALDVIYSNPDIPVSRSRTGADGQPEEYTTTMREYLADLEAEAKQADLDTLATQTALNCALQFGN